MGTKVRTPSRNDTVRGTRDREKYRHKYTTSEGANDGRERI